MDDQQAETLEKYNTENPGAGECDVRFGTRSGTPSGFGPVMTHVVN